MVYELLKVFILQKYVFANIIGQQIFLFVEMIEAEW